MFISVSDYNYPEDEFDVSEDEGPVPVGVHRAQLPRWRSWLPLLAIIIIVPALAWGAVSLLRHNTPSPQGADSAAPQEPAQDEGRDAAGSQDSEAPQDGPGAEASPSGAAGPADLTLGVTVLNGTETSGLAGRTGDRLTNGGFTSVTVPQGIYEGAEPQRSTVYYSSEEHRTTAEEVGKQLGITDVVEDPASAQTTPIVVVLREDFSE